eukprot:SM000181S03540  [mRNA]  locus=s181:72477:78627:- [translate_table: standard]
MRRQFLATHPLFDRLAPPFLELREEEYAHLDKEGLACFDYTGAGLFSYNQQQPVEEGTVECELQRKVLEYLCTTPADYSVIFTANLGAALQLMGESYPFAPGQSVVTAYDHHCEYLESVRKAAERAGSLVVSAPIQWPELQLNGPELTRLLDGRPAVAEGGKDRLGAATVKPEPLTVQLDGGGVGGGCRGLLVMSAQSKVSGVRASLDWVPAAQRRGWHVLLDASALSPGEFIDLKAVQPDFLACSFYKVFGADPSGFGCLLVRTGLVPSAEQKLALGRKAAWRSHSVDLFVPAAPEPASTSASAPTLLSPTSLPSPLSAPSSRRMEAFSYALLAEDDLQQPPPLFPPVALAQLETTSSALDTPPPLSPVILPKPARTISLAMWQDTLDTDDCSVEKPALPQAAAAPTSVPTSPLLRARSPPPAIASHAALHTAPALSLWEDGPAPPPPQQLSVVETTTTGGSRRRSISLDWTLTVAGVATSPPRRGSFSLSSSPKMPADGALPAVSAEAAPAAAAAAAADVAAAAAEDHITSPSCYLRTLSAREATSSPHQGAPSSLRHGGIPLPASSGVAGSGGGNGSGGNAHGHRRCRSFDHPTVVAVSAPPVVVAAARWRPSHHARSSSEPGLPPLVAELASVGTTATERSPRSTPPTSPGLAKFFRKDRAFQTAEDSPFADEPGACVRRIAPPPLPPPQVASSGNSPAAAAKPSWHLQVVVPHPATSPDDGGAAPPSLSHSAGSLSSSRHPAANCAYDPESPFSQSELASCSHRRPAPWVAAPSPASLDSAPYSIFVEADNVSDDGSDGRLCRIDSISGRLSGMLVCRGLEHVQLLHSLGATLIHRRLDDLTDWLLTFLKKLRHPGIEGRPLVEIYGPPSIHGRGAVVAFNIVDWKWDYVPPTLVQLLADRINISLSTGYLWRPDSVAADTSGQAGAASTPSVAASTGHRLEEKAASSGSLFQQARLKIGGGQSAARSAAAAVVTAAPRPAVSTNYQSTAIPGTLPVVSVSLGLVTNFDDVYRVWSFIAKFLDASFIHKESVEFQMLNKATFKIG